MIMTANFKRFKLKPTAKQGKNYNDGTPFIKYIMDKAAKGVSVQIICSTPSATFKEEWKDYYQQLGNPKMFKYKVCKRNHAKAYIVDNRIAYIGSANVTKAGIRQLSPENFEVGILTEDQEMLSSVKSLFSSVWNGDKCSKCPKVEECNKENRL